jgi:hypothetical protein
VFEENSSGETAVGFLDQNGKEMRAFVNAVMNYGESQKARNFFTC